MMALPSSLGCYGYKEEKKLLADGGGGLLSSMLGLGS